MTKTVKHCPILDSWYPSSSGTQGTNEPPSFPPPPSVRCLNLLPPPLPLLPPPLNPNRHQSQREEPPPPPPPPPPRMQRLGWGRPASQTPTQNWRSRGLLERGEARLFQGRIMKIFPPSSCTLWAIWPSMQLWDFAVWGTSIILFYILLYSGIRRSFDQRHC